MRQQRVQRRPLKRSQRHDHHDAPAVRRAAPAGGPEAADALLERIDQLLRSAASQPTTAAVA